MVHDGRLDEREENYRELEEVEPIEPKQLVDAAELVFYGILGAERDQYHREDLRGETAGEKRRHGGVEPQCKQPAIRDRVGGSTVNGRGGG